RCLLFNRPPLSRVSTLSLHDALPISGALTIPRYIAATRPGSRQQVVELEPALVELVRAELPLPRDASIRVRYGDAREVLGRLPRSEEHTSELQSRENLVCRLLPEKKK